MRYLLTLLLLTWAAWGQCANSNSVNFDSVDDSVLIAYPGTNAAGFTFFFQTKSSADPAGFHYYLINNGGFNRVLIYNSSGALGYRFGSGGLTSIGAGPSDSISATGEWETLAIVSDRAGTDSVAFIHVTSGTEIFKGPLAGTLWSGVDVYLGGNASNSVIHKMDNFAYFEREIPLDTLTLMDGADLTDYGPKFYFKFDGDYDDSGSLGTAGTNGGTTFATDVPFATYSGCESNSTPIRTNYGHKYTRYINY